jgi:hypothetical protein
VTLAFCPQCGTKRLGTARHCANCGADYWKLASGAVTGLSPSAMPVTAPGPTPSAEPNQTDGVTPNLLLIAGLAWIGSAAAIGYLAFLQLQYASTQLPGAEDVGTVALWNGVTAAVTLYFGAKIIIAPTRRLMTNSTIWAVLTVAYGVYQVSQGVTADVYILALVLAGVAGVLSFGIPGQMPKPVPTHPA